MSSKDKEGQANQLLSLAESCRDNGDFSASKDLYSQALTLLVDIYKSADKGSERQSLLFKLIEFNMVEAEKVKAKLLEQQAQSSSITQAKTGCGESSKSLTTTIANIFRGPSNTEKKATDRKGSSVSEVTHRQVPSDMKTPPIDPKNIPDDFDYTSNAFQQKKKNPRAGTGAPSAITASKVSQPSSRVTTSRSAVGSGSGNGRVATNQSSPISASSPPSSSSSTSDISKSSEYETQILNEMMDTSPGIQWSDIAGLTIAKQTLQEAVILPNIRPDLFTGLRAPPRGALLFGPPGTGKTLLAKAVATESGFSFFSITSSSVTSKYIGEGEKLMKALFSVARRRQPAVIFFDEIDALMSSRKDGEHEASRRLKTEFMTQVDGATTSGDDRLLIMGATNLPWEIDEEVLRRLVKRIYVPLPDAAARSSLISHLLAKGQTDAAAAATGLSSADLAEITIATDGYSASDLTALCHEAAMGPIRELRPEDLKTVRADAIRKVQKRDFLNAISIIRPSVSVESLAAFQKWSDQYAVLR